ncbi:MAG: hypothetical protein IPM97_16135 [Bdellovibrionaceae bacterium]|nr:hypothetical protein [Pseudobdellovibrionaceae bacterium]
MIDKIILFLVFVISACAVKSPRKPNNEASQVEINLTSKIKSFSLAPVGISLNQLNESAFPLDKLKEALKNSGVKYLRFPEGESADNYLWSVPPYEKSHGKVSQVNLWPANDPFLVNSDATFKQPLDFDGFTQVLKDVGAEANIVLCYPCGDKVKSLELAKQWVRYANITKKLGIKNWELGNETYLKNYLGPALPVQEYAKDLIQFSSELKKIDPTIRIGANGDKPMWWRQLLTYRDTNTGKSVADSIDFVVFHNYPLGGSTQLYEDYLSKTDLTGSLKELKKIIQEHAPKLTIAVTETNALSFKGADQNNLGSAIVVFDIIGQLLIEPKVEYVQLWTSHWVKNKFSNNLQNAFDLNNEPLPIGKSLGIWGKNLKSSLVKAVTTDSDLKTYASHSESEKKITIFLINPRKNSKEVSVSIAAQKEDFSEGHLVAFTGNDVNDLNPKFSDPISIKAQANSFSLTLRPTSISIINLKATN